MNYIRKFMYETRIGKYLSLFLPVSFLISLGCSGRYHDSMSVDLDGNGTLDSLYVKTDKTKALFEQPRHHVISRFRNEKGELGPEEKIIDFRCWDCLLDTVPSGNKGAPNIRVIVQRRYADKVDLINDGDGTFIDVVDAE
ncbi:MAG: hypothetical protein JW754_00300 [Candidatus Aenigmarchaeota archaeon]|nr:hypothetical protein [Candidatus Aenigmarchaeota archaeon]